jgi:nitric oxide reductase subunit B
VYAQGLAYARSHAFRDTTISWQWMRLPGDVAFARAALLMTSAFLVKLRPLQRSAAARGAPGRGVTAALGDRDTARTRERCSRH